MFQLVEFAVIHDDDFVGHRESFFLVVRDEYKRNTNFLLNALELDLHLFSELEVECGEWFVEEEDGRLVDECARNGNALLLPTRHLIDVALAVIVEIDEFEHSAHFSVDDVFGHFFEFETEGDVIVDVEMRE